MAQVEIRQQPGSPIMPVGQEIVFTVGEDTVVANMERVRFFAEVHVGNTMINFSSPDQNIGSYTTVPNNKGGGMFDMRPVLEGFVSSDNKGSTLFAGSTYKGASKAHPIHLIDKISCSDNAIKWFGVMFTVDSQDPATLLYSGRVGNTGGGKFLMFNGVVYEDEPLFLSNGNYSYILSSGYGQNVIMGNPSARFLTNAPDIQYALPTDYGTMAFFGYAGAKVHDFVVEYFNDVESLGDDVILQDTASGGSSTPSSDARVLLMYLGIFPGNLRNWSATFQAAVSAAAPVTYYTFHARDISRDRISRVMRINILCPNGLGYEPVRLAWLNKWGVWDYYTFNKKSVVTTSTKRIKYTQRSGTWNEDIYNISGYKGGEKNLKVNSTEKIKISTDFITEAESLWFEELMNSVEVYIVKGYEEDSNDASFITNKYIEPVSVTTASIKRKTRANDKLISYSFTVEKSKTQRTQSV